MSRKVSEQQFRRNCHLSEIGWHWWRYRNVQSQNEKTIFCSLNEKSVHRDNFTVREWCQLLIHGDTNTKCVISLKLIFITITKVISSILSLFCFLQNYVNESNTTHSKVGKKFLVWHESWAHSKQNTSQEQQRSSAISPTDAAYAWRSLLVTFGWCHIERFPFF